MSHNISLYNLLDQMYMNIALFAKKMPLIIAWNFLYHIITPKNLSKYLHVPKFQMLL